MNFDKELDTRGLNCPLPILRTKKSLNDMQSGQLLKVRATDPGSVKDFQAFAKQTGNELVSSETIDTEFVFFMKRNKRGTVEMTGWGSLFMQACPASPAGLATSPAYRRTVRGEHVPAQPPLEARDLRNWRWRVSVGLFQPGLTVRRFPC